MIENISSLIGGAALAVGGTNIWIIGAIVVFLFIALGLVLKLSGGVFLVVLPPLIFILAQYNFLPGFFQYLIGFALPFIIAFAIIKVARRR